MFTLLARQKEKPARRKGKVSDLMALMGRAPMRGQRVTAGAGASGTNGSE